MRNSKKKKKNERKEDRIFIRKIKNSNLLNPENLEREINFEFNKKEKKRTKSKNSVKMNKEGDEKLQSNFSSNSENFKRKEVFELKTLKNDFKEDLEDKIVHKPVLLEEVLNHLDLKENLVVFDGTLGQGGYSEEIMKKIGENGKLLATDLDADAISFSQRRLKKYLSKKLIFQKNFSGINEILAKTGIEKIDRAVLDLGFGSHQLDNSNRGISFLNENEPLNMNLSSENSDLTAREILNFWEEEALADIFSAFGGEKHAKLVARKIIEERKKKEFKNVGDLTKLLVGVLSPFYKNQKIHPATRVFQALRIVVNDELGNLSKALKNIFENLSENGIISVVTFHSLEDKIVKKYFRELENSGLATRINKKVVKPTENEINKNKRSRSAKLRSLIKTPLNKKNYKK